MNDTTAEMEAEFRARIRATTVSERLRMMSGMFATARALAVAAMGSSGVKDVPAAILFERMYRTDFSVGEIAAISQHLRTTLAR
jgi:hypothetical protein